MAAQKDREPIYTSPKNTGVWLERYGTTNVVVPLLEFDPEYQQQVIEGAATARAARETGFGIITKNNDVGIIKPTNPDAFDKFIERRDALINGELLQNQPAEVPPAPQE